MSNEDAQETIAEVTGVGSASRGSNNVAVVLVIFGMLFGLLVISSVLTRYALL